MNPDNTLTIPAYLEIAPVELFMPEPIETWTLVDLADIDLIPGDVSDAE